MDQKYSNILTWLDFLEGSLLPLILFVYATSWADQEEKVLVGLATGSFSSNGH